MLYRRTLSGIAVASALFAGCSAEGGSKTIGLSAIPPLVGVEGPCVAPAPVAGEAGPTHLLSVGCAADFRVIAAQPSNTSIPGALSAKIILDRVSGKVYFQNTNRYKLHWEFASTNLSGNGLPIVPALSDFNRTEYYSPDRRFVLAAITFYSEAKLWALEISPYDTASIEMVSSLHTAIKAAAYFGPDLIFHPTSDTVERTAANLPKTVPVVTTSVLYAGISYQPLNLATSLGRLRFVKAADLEKAYVSFRDIVVLDRVPNDISVVTGLITQEFQTPLSHVNVLSQNRGTPNMALRNAFSDPKLRSYDGKWVRLRVGAFDYGIEEITLAEADVWWAMNRPAAVGIPAVDLTTTELRDVTKMVDVSDPMLLRDRIKAAIPAYGGKTSHYAVLAQVPGVPVPKAFGIPVFYYAQFMSQNGFDERVTLMLADATFRGDPAVRDATLAKLRADMEKAPVDATFQLALFDKLNRDYPKTRMRFRSSTNAEDLEGFTGAGLYTSHSGQPGDPDRPVFAAIRKVWASIWFFRAFEEREYRSIDHRAVGMALLVHNSFPNEAANGVALTANPFDTSGADPALYINVQQGEESVVQPDPSITTDQFLYYYYSPNRPIVFLDHSSLISANKTVLTATQTYELGTALDRIHQFFLPAYGTTPGVFFAMDVEFKFDGNPPVLAVKQARPHPGRGL